MLVTMLFSIQGRNVGMDIAGKGGTVMNKREKQAIKA